MNCLKKYFTDYQSPGDMYKTLRVTEGKKMKIKYMQSKSYQIKWKKFIEKIPENKKCKVEKNEKIINIVDNILYFNNHQDMA